MRPVHASANCAFLSGRHAADADDLVGLELVLREFHASSETNESALLTALLAAGPRGVRELFEALSVESSQLETSERRTLQGALGDLPRYVLNNRADQGKSSKRVEQEIKIALQVIAELGVAEDFMLAVRLALPEDPLERADARRISFAVDSLAELLRRDAKALGELPQVYRALDPRAKPMVLRAAGSVALETSLDFLSSQLGADATLDLIVLGQIGRVAGERGLTIDQSTRTYLLMSLASPDPAYRREASLTLGRLEETEAVPDLIELLSDPDSGVARNAHWALERTTRKHIEPDPERWRTWLTKEQLWWAKEADGALKALRSEHSGKASAAIRQLATHRLHRHEVAGELVYMLGHGNDSLVEQACGALLALGSRPTRSHLEPLLQHSSAGVRLKAQQALNALTAQP